MFFITKSPLFLNWSVRFVHTAVLVAAWACWSMAAHSAINIPDLTTAQLNPDYWQTKLAKDEVMAMKESQIDLFNQQLFATNPHMQKPLDRPDSLDGAALKTQINAISSLPQSARFYADGKRLSQQDYQPYVDNLNIKGIKARNPLHFGLVVARSAMRTFPTLVRVFNEQMDLDLDRFQETALFPGEAVAVLHISTDGQWYLVQNYNYLGWVQSAGIALGNRPEIRRFIDNPHFLVVSGAKVMTSYVPGESGISQVQLDMGVKLPLLSDSEQQGELYGQSTAGSYQVKLPVRNDDGSLSIKTALIGRTQDVHLGYLDFTPANVIAQAFKFLGERYGWGHDYNGRDCTGFIGEIFKSFGILMPRNSGQQGNSDYGTNFRFAENADLASKLAVIEQLQVGDLIYIPGHVMMYLGEENNQPFVIHDVKGLAYWTPEGEFYKGVLNAVSVTPLVQLHLDQTTTYLDKIYNIKRISLAATQGP